MIVSSLTPPKPHLLFCCVLSIFALILLVYKGLFCATIRKDSVSLLRFSFLIYVQVCLWEISLFVAWNCLQLFFSPFLFSGYFHSVDASVVYIGFDRCNQSSSGFFNVLFCCCIDASILNFNAGEFSSPFFSWPSLSTSFLWCKVLCIVMSFLVHLFHFRPLQKFSRISD